MTVIYPGLLNQYKLNYQTICNMFNKLLQTGWKSSRLDEVEQKTLI